MPNTYIKTSSKLMGFLRPFSILLLTLNYAVYYFYSFNEGISNAPRALTVSIKLVTIVLLYCAFPPRIFDINRLVIFISIVILPGTYFVLKYLYGYQDFLFLNYFLFAGFLFTPVCDFHRVSKYLCVIVALQIIFFTLLIELNLLSPLWNNGAMSGGFGNPSEFAFFILYCIIYLFAFNNPLFILLIPIYALGIIYAQSMLMFILLVIFSLHMLARRFVKRRKDFISIVILLIIGFLFYLSYSETHLAAKLKSFIVYGVADSSPSLSVSNRIDWVGYHLFRFRIGLINPFFGDVGDLGYVSGDNQLLSFLSLGGVPLLAFACSLITLGILNANRLTTPNSLFLKYFYTLFILFLIFNRALEYFPVSILLFLTLGFQMSKTKSI